MAEDFHDAFGLGTSEETIAALDTAGVALAAIQGLADRLSERDERIDEKDERIDELEGRLERIESALDLEE